MNNKKIILIILIVAITSIVMIINHSFKEKFLLEKGYDYKFIYIGNNVELNIILSKEEKEILYNIFNKQTMFKDNLSCGFDEDMMFMFGGKKLLIASDGCPFFFIKDKNRYIKITKEEMEQIKIIIEKNGGKIPNI